MKTFKRERKRENFRQKKIATETRRVVIGFMIALAIIGIIVVIAYPLSKEGAISTESNQTIRIRTTFMNAISEHMNQDTWWVDDDPPATLEIFERFEAKRAQISRLLEIFKNTTAETRQIADHFEGVRATVFVHGKSQEINYTGSARIYSSNALSILFLPPATASQARLYVPQYSTGLHAITVPAIDIPERLYAALLFHECGHAFRHPEASPEPKGDDETDVHTQEEVEMHELGGRVMNAASSGAYEIFLEKILARSAGKKHFEDAVGAITSLDYAEAGRIFGTSETDIPHRMVVSQCTFDISFRFCDSLHLGMPEKILAYRWLNAQIIK